MRKIAFFGFMLAAVVALVIVFASSSVTRDGKVEVGVKSAEACKNDGTPDCLPRIGYFDTSDMMWTGEALDGKVVMVNFWATWCAPCKKEVPALTAAYKKYADQGFVLLGIMTDDPTDEELKEFSEAYNLDYPVVRIDQDLMSAFDSPPALPTTFVYDRTGKLRLRKQGPISEKQIDRLLPELLAEAAPVRPSDSKPASEQN